MKLNNKELFVISNKIFDEVSKPIIEANEKKLKEYVLPEDHWFVSLAKKHNALVEQKKRLDEEISNIKKILISKLDTYIVPYGEDLFMYAGNIKQQEVKLSSYPTIQDIESDIILASNTDFETLVKNIIKKYKKNG